MDEPLAKPRQGLLKHLRQVAGLGEEIAHRLELPLELRRRALLACWLHDVGKALPSFQGYIQAVRSLEQARLEGASGARLMELEEETRRKKARAFPRSGDPYGKPCPTPTIRVLGEAGPVAAVPWEAHRVRVRRETAAALRSEPAAPAPVCPGARLREQAQAGISGRPAVRQAVCRPRFREAVAQV